MRKWIAPIGIAVAVLALVVGGSVWGSSHKPDHGKLPPLPPLAIAANGQPEAARMAAGTADARPAPYGRTEYRLTGTLPSEPTESPAYQLGRDADEARIRALAKSLGIDAAPTRTNDGWQATDGEYALNVANQPGLPWYYSASRCASDTPTSAPGAKPAPATEPDAPVASTVRPAQCGSSTGVAYACAVPPCPANADCAVPSPCPTPTEPPRPSESDAMAAAHPILVAAGLDSAEVKAQPGYGTYEVDASPVVAGLPTIGWSTHVSVNNEKKVQYANGWLADTKATAAYPLRTSQSAFDDLKNQPQPEILIACAPDSTCPSQEPRTVDVTGARLGLMFGPPLDAQADSAYLVPTWLFATSDGELPVIALPDEYIAKPSPAPDETGKPVPPPNPATSVDSGPGSSGSGGTSGYDPGSPNEPTTKAS